MEEIREQNKGTKRRIIIFGILLFGVVSILGGVTYAFFAGNFGQTENEVITIKSGTLQLTFKDYNTEATPGVNGTWTFGDSIEKELVIKNTGTLDAYAKISWDNLVNTYLAQSLTYTLEEKSDEEEVEYHTVNTGNVPQSTTSSTKELANGLLIKAGKTYTYKLTITLEDLPNVNQTDDLEAKFITKFTLEEGEESDSLLLNTIMKKSNPVEITQYTLGTQGEMYTFDHDEAGQTTGWSAEERRDYRYIGATPNNWLKFNGEDWRIIGVFTTEIENDTKEQLIKIIRNESIGDFAINSSYDNDWNNSLLQQLLNGDYFNQSGEYALGSDVEGLSIKSQSQIENAKWYLGGDSDDGWVGMDHYYSERSTVLWSGYLNSIEQKVGLIYPSDYVYTYSNGVDNNCYTYNCDPRLPNTGWLFDGTSQWTQSPTFHNTSFGIAITSQGSLGKDHYFAKDRIGVRPVVFLKSGINLIDGDGSQSHPYIIE